MVMQMALDEPDQEIIPPAVLSGTASSNPLNKPRSPRQVRSRFKAKPQAGIRLEPRDEELLCGLFLHRAMSREQIQFLYFTSLVRCNARLRQLFDHGFVSRYFLPAAPFGAQAVYMLGRQGVPVVARRLDRELDEIKTQRQRADRPIYLEHTLAIVDTRIDFLKALQAQQQLELWLSEYQCRHEYDVSVLGQRKEWRVVFKPDAFVRLHDLGTGAYYPFFIEVERGHVALPRFVTKLKVHQQYGDSGLFEERYGTPEFKTLIITTSPRRIAHISALPEVRESGLFLFTTFDQM
jgi:hypothetical protein